MNLLDHLLPEPDFVTRDPIGITQKMVSDYEKLTEKTLYPAQVERLLIDVMAYRESLLREAIQDAAKLNLVRYSRAPILDYLGENIGVRRLGAVKARTQLRFTFNRAITQASFLPQGTLVEGGEVSFSTITQTSIAVGMTYIDVEAECTKAGLLGNGFVIGQIKTLSNPVAGLSIDTVQNITLSAGGADAEDDERFRERIVLAPEQFSNAGSVGAYRFYALSAHPDIIDVAVTSPSAGLVNIYPLVKTGIPDSSVKAAVLAACNAERVRPLTDHVQVLDPVRIDYAISAQLTLCSAADAVLAKTEARRAGIAYRDRLQARLGQDIVRTQLIDALHVYGVYSLTLAQPAVDRVLTEASWPFCTEMAITIANTVHK